jgi:hypothetical protein
MKVHDEKCLDWVKSQNEETMVALGKPGPGDPTYDRILNILDSKVRRGTNMPSCVLFMVTHLLFFCFFVFWLQEKIPYVEKINGLYYNFWQYVDTCPSTLLQRRFSPFSLQTGTRSMSVAFTAGQQWKSWCLSTAFLFFFFLSLSRARFYSPSSWLKFTCPLSFSPSRYIKGGDCQWETIFDLDALNKVWSNQKKTRTKSLFFSSSKDPSLFLSTMFFFCFAFQ